MCFIKFRTYEYCRLIKASLASFFFFNFDYFVTAHKAFRDNVSSKINAFTFMLLICLLIWLSTCLLLNTQTTPNKR